MEVEGGSRANREYHDSVKRAGIIAIVVLLSGALFAQVHGVPASVTSYGPGRSVAPGVPASVTSLGPRGYSNPCNQPGCANAFFFYPFGATPNSISKPTHTGVHNHPGHRPGHNGNYSGYGYGYGGYTYVPYAVPVAVPVEPEEVQPVEEAEPPAPTVFERRPVVQPAPYTTVERSANADQNAEPKHVNLTGASEEQIPVVIVYKDGHQHEIANGNYAIVGDLLYDLSGPIAKKIKLADLDLAQTVQLNEQRGVEFTLPAAYKPQA
jgi:hypothetical protein